MSGNSQALLYFSNHDAKYSYIISSYISICCSKYS